MATRSAALAWLYLHSLRRFLARSTVFFPVNLRLPITLNHFRHYISFIMFIYNICKSIFQNL
ncbi:Uncharacterized protein APZ42_021259 [Daphnia magna]|uniref:Uncharacterized protein n=1 Tax=Daphnia magna TaxID=35525 RepID=A0A164WTZ0_9CRUS|nr:Uncharacterized protein APZ42_021259 [Daphnia magna]